MLKLRDRRHCSPDELIDLAEGARSAAEVRHLATCAWCRQQVLEVRSALAAARAVPVPEPSPLYWDHLSARVRETVAAEGATRPAASRRWWPLFPAAAAVGAVLWAIVAPVQRPSVGTPAPIPTADAGQREGPVEVAVEDVSIELLRELASGIGQEVFDAVGLDASAGLADLALADLNADEQRELARLLSEAL